MRYKIVVVLLGFMSSVAFAQQRGGYGGGTNSQITGKITGTITDGESSEKVAYATVVVKSSKSGETVNGMVTGDDGSFKFIGLKLGKYSIEVTFVGYSKFQQEVELTPKNPDYNFENIKLTTDTNQLQEVVVSGQRETIENKIDRIVYNAELDVANMGGDASDVLRRAPLLTVDQDGNVSLRGNQNVQILINGKPSSMFGASTGDALKMIPSDQIKSVEVITSPSAKYDGEGTAGIINIITKKQTPQGFAGNVDLTAGTRINRGVLGINAGRGRLGFNANASTFYSYPQNATTEFYQKTVNNNITTIRTQNGDNLSNRIGYFGNMGAFYDFNAYHSLSTSLRLRGFNSASEGTNTVNQEVGGVEAIPYQRFQDNTSQNWGYEWSLDYVMKFPEQEGREFSASYKIDGNIRDQQFEIRQEATQNYEVANNNNAGNNTENTVQLDYTHPFGEKFKVETGFKSILRNIDSDFQYESKPEESPTYIEDAGRTDIFNYNQDVYSGYLSTQTNFTKDLGLIAGVRYEYTGLEGSFRDATENNFDPLHYENWLPSVIVSQKLGKFNTLKLSYNRRIQRPSLRNVNPYKEIGNVRNVSYGNPELNSELSDNYEVGFSTFLKGTSLNISAFYNDISEVIQSVIYEDTDNNETVTTFENVGTQQNIGSNLFISTEFFKIWTVRGGLNANYFMSEGIIQGQAVANDAWLFSGNISTSLKLPNDWLIDGFGFARPKRQTLQGYTPSFSIFGMGIKKQLWDKRGSIGLSITEPFRARKPFETELGDKESNFYQNNVFSMPFRSFGINFSYKFGQLDYKARQKSSRISNDDQKSGGDEGQNF